MKISFEDERLLDYLTNPYNNFNVDIGYDVDYHEYFCSFEFENGNAYTQYKINSFEDIGKALREWLQENEIDLRA